MSGAVITAFIAASGAVMVAAISYWFTKKHERESELRKEKLEHHKEFAVCLSGIVRGGDTPESQRGYSLARNKLNLIAPCSVIKALQEFRSYLKIEIPLLFIRNPGESRDPAWKNFAKNWVPAFAGITKSR